MVVDSLLKLVAAQNADALVLPADAPPFLERGGEPKPLSMPALGEEVLSMALQEVTDAEQRDRLEQSGVVQIEYATPNGETFSLTIEQKAGKPRFTFRKAEADAPQAPSPPVPAPVSASPPVRPAVETPRPEPPTGPIVSIASAARVTATGLVAHALQRAQLDGASDVLLSAGRIPRIRVGTHLVEVGDIELDESELVALLEPVMHAGARQDLETTGGCDVALIVEGHPPVRHRVNVFRQQSGLAAALRPIRREVPTLRDLGLPDELYRLTEHRSGLVLMTGTAGSGKSTTLVALIEHVNRTAPKHVITLEDPIEYEYAPGRALIHQREIGRDVDGFATGLRAALRESPDIILVGEMRDRETIAAALTAAETGHLVLSTLHCASASTAMDRIVDVFEEHRQPQVRFQLAATLRAVVTQVLLPSTSRPSLVPAYEKLVVNTAVATKIREGRGHQLQSEIQKGRGEGMVPLEVSLARLLRARQISMETARAVTGDAQVLDELVRRG